MSDDLSVDECPLCERLPTVLTERYSLEELHEPHPYILEWAAYWDGPQGWAKKQALKPLTKLERLKGRR